MVAGCAAPTMEVPAFDERRLKQETRTQRIAYVKDAYQQQRRLNRISYQLGTAAGDLCRGRRVNRVGAFFSDWDERAAEWLDAAVEATGINLHEYGIEVVDILENSPAARAGLKVGDHIIRLEGERLPRGRGAMAVFRKKFVQLRTGESAELKLRVRREAEFLTLTIVPEKGCEFPAVLTSAQDLNAFTDGEVIYLNRGLAQFVESDDELATIITHEMAHITMGHIDAMRQNVAAGAAVGIIVDILLAGVIPGYGPMGGKIFQEIGAQLGALSFSQEFEAEADYVALYFMARAGFDIRAAPNLWRRFAVVEPKAIEKRPLASHPSAPERFLLLDQTVKEIEGKVRAGAPLTPNLKPREPESAEDAPAQQTGNP